MTQLSSTSNVRKPSTLLSNLRKGIGLGLVVATGFSLIATIIWLAYGSTKPDSAGSSYGALIGMYYAGGLLGGALVGLAWPLKRYLLGSALLGVVGVFPLYLGAAFLESGRSHWLAGDNLQMASLLALLVGAPVGCWSWLRANPPPQWIRGLLYPTRITVSLAWFLGIAVSATSLFLTKWTGDWPFALVVLVALMLFAAPLGVALFVTLRRLGDYGP
jgi:hypothetical protein